MTLLVGAEGGDEDGTFRHTELLEEFKRSDDLFSERPAHCLMRWIREKYMKIPQV